MADIVWTNGVPSLANVTTIEPQTNHFYEPYGFSPDGSHIIFASDLGMSFWWDSQIYSVATDGTGLTRLSPADAPEGLLHQLQRVRVLPAARRPDHLRPHA